jgi:hypothetical protein
MELNRINGGELPLEQGVPKDVNDVARMTVTKGGDGETESDRDWIWSGWIRWRGC